MLMAFVGRLTQRWRDLIAALQDPYRPELHYMRGPGPRWRERHPDAASPRSISLH